MSQFSGESWLEAQAEYSVSSDAHDQLAERPKPTITDVWDAVDWGLTKRLPLADQLKETMDTSSNWGICGSVMLSGDQSLTIRTAPSGEIARVHELLKGDLQIIVNRVEWRDDYDYRARSANGIMHYEQKENTERTAIRSVIGGILAVPITMVYGNKVFDEKVLESLGFVAYEPNPYVVSAVWIVGSAIRGIVKARDIRKKRDEKIKNAKACDLPPGAEENWQKLEPFLEQVVKDYTIESQPGDVRVTSETYSVEVKELKKKLRKSDGAKPKEYSGLLNELKENEKYRKLSKAELCINPADIVREALVRTDGKVWGTEFSYATQQIAASQVDREALKRQLAKLEESMRNVSGVDRSIGQAFRDRIERCEDTITLATLDIFKLYAAYLDEQHRPLLEQAPMVEDPFNNEDRTEPKGFQESSDETQESTNWPLMKQKLDKA